MIFFFTVEGTLYLADANIQSEVQGKFEPGTTGSAIAYSATELY